MKFKYILPIIGIILTFSDVYARTPSEAIEFFNKKYATYANSYNAELLNLYSPDAKIIKKIYSVGVPSIVMASIGSVMNVCINQIVRVFDAATAETAQAVFGIYFKLQSFLIMPVSGLNNGMVPIIAFNYGAKNKERIRNQEK